MVFIAECGTRLAAAGYAAFGVDYEGHGRSKGARCYINKFQNIVNDCREFFKSISEEVKPHPMVVNMLTEVEEIIPKWKIVPTKNVIDTAFKDPIKRETVWTFNSSCSNLMIRKNKLIYQDKPGLKTALEMLRTSISLERDLNEVTLPFFVLHGEADIVTDPEVSKALYEKSSSSDKTIKLYPGMWHGLTSGEPDENIEIVFTDITAWLDKQLL
ncbi:hypothetical protein Gotri_012850 [Gossypium trilobum]|uniref:Serine aminopeptidase S33 domain-containing protein n=1 Tax=Gossypium trilobum TaxID=34281 RepID=A0A7J9DRR5_9ROSI|nr:hypothetical protein [Gossypium trilobum]